MTCPLSGNCIKECRIKQNIYAQQCWSESGLVSPAASPSPQGQSPSPSGQSPSPSAVSPSPLDQSPSPVGQSPSPRVQQKTE